MNKYLNLDRDSDLFLILVISWKFERTYRNITYILVRISYLFVNRNWLFIIT